MDLYGGAVDGSKRMMDATVGTLYICDSHVGSLGVLYKKRNTKCMVVLINTFVLLIYLPTNDGGGVVPI